MDYFGIQSSKPSNPHGSQQWDTGPQVVHTADEQDTAKYVYGEKSSDEVPAGVSGGKTDQRRMVCGLSVLVFCIMLALAAVAIAGAVGGGVAGSMAANRCRTELRELRQSVSTAAQSAPESTRTSTQTTASPSSSSTSSSSATAAPSTITVPETDCPSTNGSSYTSTFGDKSISFVKICNTVKTGGGMSFFPPL